MGSSGRQIHYDSYVISDFVAGCGNLRLDRAGDCRLQPWWLPGFSGSGIYWRTAGPLDFPATWAQGTFCRGNRQRALPDSLVDYRRDAIRGCHQPLQAEGILSGGDTLWPRTKNSQWIRRDKYQIRNTSNPIFGSGSILITRQRPPRSTLSPYTTLFRSSR